MSSGSTFEGADRRGERAAEGKADHERLASRSTPGVSLTFPDSGPNNQLAPPDAVVPAIGTVVGKVRPGRPAG